MRKTILISILSVAIIFCVGYRVLAQDISTGNNTNMGASAVNYYNLKITPAMVASAGFTQVTEQKAEAGKFLAPVFYFRAKETAAASLGWKDSSNLITVLVEPKIDRDWQFNGGNIEERAIDGRIQTRLTNTKYYFVVTGPDKDKVLSLARNLSEAFK